MSTGVLTGLANVMCSRYYKMTEEIEPHVLEQYQVVKKIGSGAYGHVWKVIDRSTRAVKALKKNFDAFCNSTDAQRTYRQIMFLRQLRYPNVIQLERVIPARSDRDIYLIFEHMDVDLHTLIRQDGRATNLQERHKQYIIYQIAKAIYLLHHCNLIHRDLKPSNVLVNESCEAKLCDFGLVRLEEEGGDGQIPLMTDYIATRWYRAPELLLGSREYSKEVDMWALGCMIGEMFNGKAMFPGSSTINQIERVLAWTGTPSPSQMKHLSSATGNNQAMLQLLTTRRKSNHNDFFANRPSSKCLQLIEKLLQFDPKKRYTIDQVLKHEYLAEFYSEKDLKEIRNMRTKIQLHVNDNKKVSVKDYRELLYQEIKQKDRALAPISTNAQKKRKQQRDKSKSRHETHHHDSRNNFNTQSVDSNTQNRSQKAHNKTTLDRSVKSKGQRRKGISLCSKSSSKHTSLSRKKITETEATTEVRQGSREGVRRIKPYSRSCTEKYDRGTSSGGYNDRNRRSGGESRQGKRVLLSECFVNNNIGRRWVQMHV